MILIRLWARAIGVGVRSGRCFLATPVNKNRSHLGLQNKYNPLALQNLFCGHMVTWSPKLNSRQNVVASASRVAALYIYIFYLEHLNLNDHMTTLPANPRQYWPRVWSLPWPHCGHNRPSVTTPRENTYRRVSRK